MGLFVWYFGIDCCYEDVGYYIMLFGLCYKGLFDDIFRNKVLVEDFSFYLYCLFVNDLFVVLLGCDFFYVLSFVFNFVGDVDWESIVE